MHQIKDTLRATVRIGYDGRVHKTFRGPKADERFANEVRVLRHLEKQGCPFVPRLLDEDPEHLKIVTTSHVRASVGGALRAVHATRASGNAAARDQAPTRRER